MAKRKKLCPHDDGRARGTLMYRCECGNVWLNGKPFCSVPKGETALNVVGRLAPPVEVEVRDE